MMILKTLPLTVFLLAISPAVMLRTVSAQGKIVFSPPAPLSVDETKFDGTQVVLSLSHPPTAPVSLAVQPNPYVRVSNCSLTFTPDSYSDKSLHLYAGDSTSQSVIDTELVFVLASADSKYHGQKIRYRIQRQCKLKYAKCRAWGDPHYQTWDSDKDSYSFQPAQIEHHYLIKNNRLTVEVEMFPCITTGREVSCHNKLAMRFGTDVVVVSIDTEAHSNSDFHFQYHGQQSVFARQGTKLKYTLSTKDGTVVTLTGKTLKSGIRYMDILIQIGAQYFRKVDGLCGTWDGNVSNDKRLNGFPVPDNDDLFKCYNRCNPPAGTYSNFRGEACADVPPPIVYPHPLSYPVSSTRRTTHESSIAPPGTYPVSSTRRTTHESSIAPPGTYPISSTRRTTHESSIAPPGTYPISSTRRTTHESSIAPPGTYPISSTTGTTTRQGKSTPPTSYPGTTSRPQSYESSAPPPSLYPRSSKKITNTPNPPTTTTQTYSVSSSQPNTHESRSPPASYPVSSNEPSATNSHSDGRETATITSTPPRTATNTVTTTAVVSDKHTTPVQSTHRSSQQPSPSAYAPPESASVSHTETNSIPTTSSPPKSDYTSQTTNVPATPVPTPSNVPLEKYKTADQQAVQYCRIIFAAIVQIKCGDENSVSSYISGCISDATRLGEVEYVGQNAISAFLTEVDADTSAMAKSRDTSLIHEANLIRLRCGLPVFKLTSPSGVSPFGHLQLQDVDSTDPRALQCKNGGQLMLSGGCDCSSVAGFKGLDCSIDIRATQDFGNGDGDASSPATKPTIIIASYAAAAFAALLVF